MINVTCAIIRNDEDEVLVVQRGGDNDHPFKWEFPGGKVKPGESNEDCIVREISEELSLDVVIGGALDEVEHDYGHKKIRLIPFICDCLIDLPILMEHIDFKWIDPADLKDIDFSEADIPVANQYARLHGKSKIDSEDKEIESEIDESGIKEMLAGKSGFHSIDLLVESAIENNNVLNVLFNYSLGDDPTLAFRAAYTIQKVAEKQELSVKPYHQKIILSMPGLTNESVIRSYLKIINLAGVAGLSEKEHGILADCTFKWLNEGDSAVAIKAFAMEALYNLSEIYPELAIELVALIKRNMEDGSAGIKARGRMILNRLNKNA